MTGCTDEDTPILPAELRRHLHPRRGGHAAGRHWVDPEPRTWIRETIEKERSENPPCSTDS